MQINRNSILLVGILVSCLILPLAVAAEEADLLLINGKVITVDKLFTIAPAVAIKDGKIAAVGSNEKIRKWIGPRTREIDLAGKTVIPGLIDAHNHMSTKGLNLLKVQVSHARSLADLLKAIKEAAQTTPKGQWIIAAGDWRDTLLKEKRTPTRLELDSVSPDHPVYLPMGGHVLIVNSLAFKLAGITKDSPDPEGGHFERDPKTRELTGKILERPALRVFAKMLPPILHEDRVRAIAKAMKEYNAAGITSVVEPAADLEDIATYYELWSKDQLTVRVMPLIQIDTSAKIQEIEGQIRTWASLGAVIPQGKTGFGDDMFRIGGLKIVADGGMTIRTAKVREPYVGDPNYYGVQVVPTEKLNEIVSLANKYNFRVGIHAVGDAAIDLVLNAYEKANRQKPISGKRFILIHGYLSRPDQFVRMKNLGIVVTMETVSMYEKASAVVKDLGRARAEAAVPAKSLIQNGIITALASDAPISPHSPLLGIYNAVTRKTAWGEIFGVGQKLTREEALIGYTRAASYISFDEKIKGTIEPGKLADLVVLSGDMLTVPEDDIKDLKVVMVIVGGRIVYPD